MLSNVQTILTKDTVRIKEEGYTSEYRFADTTQEIFLRIRHQKTTAKGGEPVKDRHNVEVVKTTFATASVPLKSAKAYLVVEQPPDDPSMDLAQALITWLAGGTELYDNLEAVMRWES